MTRDEWIFAFAREVGVQPPSAEQIEQLLALSGDAAHASERTAAPLTCWLGGQSGLSLDALLAAAERVRTAAA